MRLGWLAILSACEVSEPLVVDTARSVEPAVDDHFSAVPLFPVVFDLVANDVGRGLQIVDVTPPSAGSDLVQTGARKVRFLAHGDFEGVETFEYTIRDALGQQSTATVSVDVAPPPSVTITDPADGTTLATSSVRIGFVVEGCRSIGIPRDAPRGCHLHTKIDGTSYAGPEGEGQGYFSDYPRRLVGLDSGTHEIEFRLVPNDGTDIELTLPDGTIVGDAVTVIVP